MSKKKSNRKQPNTRPTCERGQTPERADDVGVEARCRDDLQAAQEFWTHVERTRVETSNAAVQLLEAVIRTKDRAQVKPFTPEDPDIRAHWDRLLSETMVHLVFLKEYKARIGRLKRRVAQVDAQTVQDSDPEGRGPNLPSPNGSSGPEHRKKGN